MQRQQWWEHWEKNGQQVFDFEEEQRHRQKQGQKEAKEISLEAAVAAPPDLATGNATIQPSKAVRRVLRISSTAVVGIGMLIEEQWRGGS